MTQQKLPKLVQDTIDWYINQEYLKEWKGKMGIICGEYQAFVYGNDSEIYMYSNNIYIWNNPKLYNYRELFYHPYHSDIRDKNKNRVGSLSPNYFHQKIYYHYTS